MPASASRVSTPASRIAYGHKVNRFFDKLVQRGYATATECLHNRGLLYHVRHYTLYCAIGQPDSRYRRPVSGRLVVERVMMLDGLLMSPELVWLGTEEEKVAFFALMAPSIPRELLPPHVWTQHVGARPVAPINAHPTKQRVPAHRRSSC
jgi:hypothetical protein